MVNTRRLWTASRRGMIALWDYPLVSLLDGGSIYHGSQHPYNRQVPAPVGQLFVMGSWNAVKRLHVPRTRRYRRL